MHKFAVLASSQCAKADHRGVAGAGMDREEAMGHALWDLFDVPEEKVNHQPAFTSDLNPVPHQL